MFIYSSVPGFIQSFKAKEYSPSPLSKMAPDSELLAPPLVPVPFLQTLCLHPHLSPSVRLAWHRLEKSEGWAFCTFGSRLILVSWTSVTTVSLHVTQSFVTQTECLTRLSTRLDLDLNL